MLWMDITCSLQITLFLSSNYTCLLCLCFFFLTLHNCISFAKYQNESSALVFNALDDGKSLLDLQLCVWASHKCWGTSTGECSCLLSSNRTILGDLLFTFQEALVVLRLSCLKQWPLEQKWPLGSTCSSLSHSPIPSTPAPNKTACTQISVHRLLGGNPGKAGCSVVLNLMAVKWHFVVA